jgi:signal transduction histidine kinase/CheY-like chemotaxis protein
MSHTEIDQMDDVHIPISIAIVLQAIIAAAYIIPIESDPVLSTEPRFRFLEAILYLSPLLTLALYHWHPQAGRWFAVLAPAVIVFALQSWLPIPGSLALLASATGLAAGLIGPRAAVGVAAASVLSLVVLRAVTGAVDGWQTGIAFIAILTTLVLTISVHRAAVAVAAWNRNYYLEAVRTMQESRAAQGALQQALDDLAHANRQMTLLYERQTVLQRMAEEAEHTKSAFVAKVSHEFRTPLNMIIGLASVMIENPRMYGRTLPAPLLEDLRIIYRNCDHLASLVNDVLALSQLQSGSVVLHREPLDLAATISEALDVVRPLINQKKLALTVELPVQLSPIAGDRTRIRQVILNLLSNAARFTDKGGIIVRASEQDEQVIIAVADSGPGISTADMERIFEPFCQASEQVWREKGGSGLGLTISKQFVELHGGRIWLESEVGVGTVFFVALPLVEARPVTRLPGSWISREWQWRERTNRGSLPTLPDRPRVVVYDPTAEIEPGLSSYGEQLELVAHAGMASVIDEVHKTPAHAVLLGADSVAGLLPLLHAAAPQLPDTPLVGWILPLRTAPALRAGANQYLIKPVSLPTLKQRLAAVAQPVHRVLIADDDEEARRLLARMLALHDADMVVAEAADGEEALRLIQEQDFDLLLLDVMMPRLNGLQVLETLRKDSRTCGMPVIMISAQDLYATQPVCSEMVIALGDGIQLGKALECTVGVAQMLFSPLRAPHQAPQ